MVRSDRNENREATSNINEKIIRNSSQIRVQYYFLIRESKKY